MNALQPSLQKHGSEKKGPGVGALAAARRLQQCRRTTRGSRDSILQAVRHIWLVGWLRHSENQIRESIDGRSVNHGPTLLPRPQLVFNLHPRSNRLYRFESARDAHGISCTEKVKEHALCRRDSRIGEHVGGVV